VRSLQYAIHAHKYIHACIHYIHKKQYKHTHRRRLRGQHGHVPPNNWETPMHLSLFTTFCLQPYTQYFGLPTQYFWQVYASRSMEDGAKGTKQKNTHTERLRMRSDAMNGADKRLNKCTWWGHRDRPTCTEGELQDRTEWVYQRQTHTEALEFRFHKSDLIVARGQVALVWRQFLYTVVSLGLWNVNGSCFFSAQFVALWRERSRNRIS